MCGRITILSPDEIREAAESVSRRLAGSADSFGSHAASSNGLKSEAEGAGGAGFGLLRPELRRQARPGDTVLALARREDGEGLEVPALFWGFEAPWGKGEGGRTKLVFNTRIESALGKSGMWRLPISEGRCILPAASFFESHASEKVKSPSTGRFVKQAYEFVLATGEPLLLASVSDGRCLSVVTTEPNAQLAPIHPRMPIVLLPEEARLWLEGSLDEIAALADRSKVQLGLRAEKRSEVTDTGETQLSLF